MSEKQPKNIRRENLDSVQLEIIRQGSKKGGKLGGIAAANSPNAPWRALMAAGRGIHTPENRLRCGRITGAKMKREGRALFAPENLGSGAHQRWHVLRGIVNPKCVFCVEGEG